MHVKGAGHAGCAGQGNKAAEGGQGSVESSQGGIPNTAAPAGCSHCSGLLLLQLILLQIVPPELLLLQNISVQPFDNTRSAYTPLSHT